MPRPSKGTDVHIYNSLDYIVPTLCRIHMHPNIITSISLLTKIKLFSVLKNPTQLSVLFFFVTHAILDCLDGEVARQCNKTSKFGAHLDTFTDHIYFAIIAAFMLSRISPFKYNTSTVFMCFILVFLWNVYGLNFDPTNHNIQGDLPLLLHDNSVLVTILFYLFFIYFFEI